MRTTKLIFAILIFLSCDNKSKPDNSGESVTVDNKETTNNELIGDWGIYVTSDGQLEARCNACPNVFFKKGGTGTVTYPTGTTEQIKWTIQKDKLTIKNISANSLSAASGNPEFHDGDYLINLSKTKTGFEMKLTKAGASDYLILRR